MFSSSQFEPNSGGGFMSSQPSQASEASTAKGLVPLTVKKLDQSGIALTNVLSSQTNYGNGRKNLDGMLLDYLKQPACTARLEGIHLDEIAQHLKIRKDKLEGVIQSLEFEGLIYSTSDEFHFRPVKY